MEIASFKQTNKIVGVIPALETEIKFKGKNLLDRTIFITGMQKSCGCTAVEYPKVIKANEEFTVVAKVKKSAPTLFSLYTTLTFEQEKEKQFIKLTFTGEFKPNK